MAWRAIMATLLVSEHSMPGLEIAWEAEVFGMGG
jgi:hypothetical protein